MPGCCLLSFHFLWAIHPIRPGLIILKKYFLEPNLAVSTHAETHVSQTRTPLSAVEHWTRAVQGEPVGAAARVQVVPEDGRAGRGPHRRPDPGEHSPPARGDLVQLKMVPLRESRNLSHSSLHR